MGSRLFEAGRLLTFSAFRKGACSRWALIRINTVLQPIHEKRFTLGLSQPHPQKITGSCPFIIISIVSRFSSLNGYSFQAIYPCTQPIQLLLIACLDSSSVYRANNETRKNRSSREDLANTARSFVLHVWVVAVHRVLCRSYSCGIQDSGAATVNITNNIGL